MGSVRKMLFKNTLPERESHHSRLFVDLAENIHIHHREYRTVFSLDEYFEYVDILLQSTNDVRNYLEQNPSYEEGKYPTTIMIAGGKERQLKFLKNSLKPNKSVYYSNDFAIELQDEFVTDEIHIHYRDFRIAMDRERFRVVAEGFKKSLEELDQFEKHESYVRENHPDRVIDSHKETYKENIEAQQMGVKSINIKDIYSSWYSDILLDWQPEQEYIKQIIDRHKKQKVIAPIIVSTEPDGRHLIVDGHHRYYAACKFGLSYIDSIILDLAFDETQDLRDAEVSLKKFDQSTNYKYSTSNYFRSYIGYRLNRYYANSFKSKMFTQSILYRTLRRIKRIIFGKRNVFKYFNEAHNHHN
jgi:hypothetical protein